MPLDTHDLHVLLVVHQHGSFGRAATELLVSQPAVSERIKRLERVIGRSLFDRTSRGVTLTPAGEALLPYARRGVALADEAVEAARGADGVPALVVAVHSSSAPRVLPLVLGALSDLPRRVAVRDVHSDVVPALVADHSAHVGFALPAPASPGLRRVRLAPDPVRCVAAAGHPITRVRRASASALVDALIAVTGWGEGAEPFLRRLERDGVQPWRVRRCGDGATALTLARDHSHVAFVPASAVPRDPGLRHVAFTGLASWTMRLELVRRTADGDDPAVAAIVEAIGVERTATTRR